jgi:antitoxin StbD
MQALFAAMTVSMSEFKKNPASILRQAGGKPVAVLNHNKAAFYMVEPELFRAMSEKWAATSRHEVAWQRGEADRRRAPAS